MKVKCTFKDCFRHFPSQEAMIQHKKKDPDHSYCERCDVDCDDDMLLFIHQLGSQAHTCCPVCGKEFATPDGRNSHVEQYHRKAQNLSCAGCQAKFTSAQSLMAHIERDECSVISGADFEMQRAEKQILKDDLEQKAESTSGRLSLLESQFSINRAKDSGGLDNMLPSHDSGRSLFSGLGGPAPVSSRKDFPPLEDARVSDNKSAVRSTTDKTTSNLIELNSAVSGMRISRLPRMTTSALEGHQVADQVKVQGWLTAVNSNVEPVSDDHSEVAAMYERKAPPSVMGQSVQPRSAVPDPNPAAKHKHITHTPASVLSSTHSRLQIERYWDAVTKKYVCPGQRCHQHFRNAAEFQQHLLSSAHVGGAVVCPSCLKRFASTAAWVAHCESASKKCDIRNSSDFNLVLRDVTGGLLGTEGHMEDGTVQYVAPTIEEW